MLLSIHAAGASPILAASVSEGAVFVLWLISYVATAKNRIPHIAVLISAEGLPFFLPACLNPPLFPHNDKNILFIREEI